VPDVFDPNATASDQQVGGHLIVESKYEFADLDELIVNHIKAMSRRIEELMAHEKFKRDEDELRMFPIILLRENV
jgi:transcription elongation factor SPT6